MRIVYCWLIVLVAHLASGCTPVVRVDKSPLATVNMSPLATWDPSQSDAFHDATVGTGTLDVSASCVRLILDNQKTILLVWPEPTSWNPSSQVIEFVGVGGERMELHNGDQITPGGSPAIGQPQYVSPPDPSCEADEIFIVSSLVPVTG